jgi:hypothetical protein
VAVLNPIPRERTNKSLTDLLTSRLNRWKGEQELEDSEKTAVREDEREAERSRYLADVRKPRFQEAEAPEPLEVGEAPQLPPQIGSLRLETPEIKLPPPVAGLQQPRSITARETMDAALREGQISPQDYAEFEREEAEANKPGGEAGGYGKISGQYQEFLMEKEAGRLPADVLNFSDYLRWRQTGISFGKVPQGIEGRKAAIAGAEARARQGVEESGKLFKIKEEEAKRDKIKGMKEHIAFKSKNEQGVDQLNEALTLIGDLYKNRGRLKGVYGAGQAAAMVPGTRFANTKADVDRLIGLNVVETLAQLKQQSPTGATGFGALSDSELNILKSSFSTFVDKNQSPEKIGEELERVARILIRYKNRVKKFDAEAAALIAKEEAAGGLPPTVAPGSP